jgi:hypothetical protein
MSHRKAVLGLVVSGLVTVLAAGMAFAQAGGGGGGGGGGGRGRGAFMDRIKEQLDVTDAEWNVLQPKLEKVMGLSGQLMAGRFGGRGGRRGGGGFGGGEANSDVMEKVKALNDTLDNKDADPKDIAQKVNALRDARERVRGELVKAQAELKEVLTPRQEARLVLMGLLD